MTEIIRLPVRTPPRFTWLLPLLFAVASVLGWIWAGHGGRLFIIGALAGIWACFLVDGGAGAVTWLVPTLLGGIPVLLLLGWLLDRLRADVLVWSATMLLISGVAGYVLMQGYPDLDKAIDYHGSFLAYAVCAVQLGSYGATLVVLGITAGRRRTIA
jgi:hypothetical protein